MREPFDAFDAALVVRDALMACSCCTDEEQGQERYDAAHELLTWVTEAKARIAVLEAIAYPSEAAARRQPLTNAERQARYRATHRVTKRNETRNESSNGAVTKGVIPAPRASDSYSENSQSSSAVVEAEEDSQSASERNESSNGDSNSERYEELARLPALDPRRKVTPREAWSAFNRACRDAGHALTFTEHPHEAAWASVAESCNAKGKPSLALETVCRWYWLADSGPIVGGRVKPGRASPKGFAAQINADLETAGEWMAEQSEAAQ